MWDSEEENYSLLFLSVCEGNTTSALPLQSSAFRCSLLLLLLHPHPNSPSSAGRLPLSVVRVKALFFSAGASPEAQPPCEKDVDCSSSHPLSVVVFGSCFLVPVVCWFLAIFTA